MNSRFGKVLGGLITFGAPVVIGGGIYGLLYIREHSKKMLDERAREEPLYAVRVCHFHL